jgi:CelD/BcsL family acetyltransferase involved in cellulose biosynthesis
VSRSPEEAAPHLAGWHALAVACGRPFLAPAFALAWYRYCRPRGSGLCVVTVHDGPELVGVGPFCVTRDVLGGGRYRVLGSGTAPRLEPLARPGRERQVAGAVAAALWAERPCPAIVSLAGVPSASPFAWLLADTWPGPPPVVVVCHTEGAPFVRIDDDGYDGWLRSRDGSFRQQLRRRERRLREAGGVCAVLEPEDHDAGVAALVRSHRARWRDRGGSRVLTPALERLLVAAPRELGGLFRMSVLRLEGEIVAASAFVTAGDTVVAWLAGFDPAAAPFGPGSLLGAIAVRDAAARAQRWLDLGPGPLEYKHRLATGVETLRWTSLVARGSTYPWSRLRLLPESLDDAAGRLLPVPFHRALRGAIRRARLAG